MKPHHQEHLTWTGNYFGGSLDFEHYEVLMVQYIPAKDRKIETQLMGTKWFDYRLMHPMQATYYFYRQYRNEYRNFYRKAINHEAAAFVKPNKEHDFILSREALSFWRLRQAVDALGIRYDFFLNFAFEQKRIMANGRPVPPRPTQIKSEELLTEAYIAWQEYCGSSLQIAKSPYFTTAKYINSQSQKDYEDFIVSQIQQRRIAYYSLSACLYLYDAIRIEKALQSFDQHTIEQAIKHAL